MPLPEFAPPQQWVELAEDLSVAKLRDPFGEPYDPETIPSWAIGSGLSFLWEHAAEIRENRGVSVLIGMQQESADLTDDLAVPDGASIIGCKLAPPPTSTELAYLQRLTSLFLKRTEPLGMDVFDENLCRTAESICHINRTVKAAATQRYDSHKLLVAALPRVRDKAKLRDGLTVLGALVHVANIRGLHLLEHTGQVMKAQGSARGHTVLSAEPWLADVERKLPLLGITPQVHRLGEASWPADVAEATQVINEVIAKGALTLIG